MAVRPASGHSLKCGGGRQGTRRPARPTGDQEMQESPRYTSLGVDLCVCVCLAVSVRAYGRVFGGVCV